MKTIILYLTVDGQTKTIAEKIAEQLDDCQLLSLRDNAPDGSEFPISSEQLAQYDQIIIGASIRFGHFDPKLERFITEHQALLNAKRSAFFSVNLTARKPNRNTPETNTYTRKLLARIAWKPTFVEVFAGALRYPRYTLFEKTMIRFIMFLTKGETDTSREFEFTNWQAVVDFGKKLAQ